MAISDKLTYLNTTKGKIKDSINLTGAGITNNDTFRSYATKLRNGLVQVLNDNGETLYNNFPKSSGSGSSITLNDTLEAPMRNKMFKGNTLQNGTPTPSTPIEIQCVEGIQTITIGDGTNSDSYTIDLGSIKLYNRDYITGTPDNWSIVRNNGSIVLNGSEDYIKYSPLDTTNYNCFYKLLDNAYIDSTGTQNLVLSNNFLGVLFINKNNDIANMWINKFASQLYFKVPNTITNTTELKTWLSTHNTEVVYKLATPTTEQITDTYLISQLNTLYNAKSCNGQTNISVSGQLPMILEVSALKDEI